MPNIMQKGVFADAVRDGIGAVKRVQQQSSLDDARHLLVEMGLPGGTDKLKNWAQESRVPDSLYDHVLRDFVLVVLARSDLDIEWLKKILGATSTMIKPPMDRAWVADYFNTPPINEQLKSIDRGVIIERLFSKEATVGTGPWNERPPSDANTNLLSSDGRQRSDDPQRESRLVVDELPERGAVDPPPVAIDEHGVVVVEEKVKAASEERSKKKAAREERSEMDGSREAPHVFPGAADLPPLPPRPLRIPWTHISLAMLTVAALVGGAISQLARGNASTGAVQAPEIREADGMVFVPAGTYTQGSTDTELDAFAELCDTYTAGCERGHFEDEKPAHQIMLSSFWIDATEVTNGAFRRFVEATGYVTQAEQTGRSGIWNEEDKTLIETLGANWRQPVGPGSTIRGRDEYPVVHVSHADAQAFCEWAGKRLPTEAEWEVAARGPQAFPYPWGSSWDAERANISTGVPRGIEPVRTYPEGRSPFGAYDMIGNVAEWVEDWYDQTAYQTRTILNDPYVSNDKSGERARRGGSWATKPGNLHVAWRRSGQPADTSDLVGFRCARQP